jgi:hypothetical protein
MMSQKFTALAIFLELFLAGGYGPCHAQSTPSFNDMHLLGTGGTNPVVTSNPVLTDQPQPTGSVASPFPQVGLPSEDTGWHFAVSPYLWFPGVHGTIGALGRDTSIHVSPGDLLSHFRFGLMGVVEARYKRLVLPLDLVWVRLQDNKALPIADLMVTAAKLKGSEFILTPKIGYLLLDQEKLKIAALVGFRYWHFSENLKFVPSSLNLNFSSSQNWVDPVVGARIQGSFTPKVIVTITGDVGGWDTGSHLDYQVAGLLGYKIKTNVILQAGYRYLYVDYRSVGTIIAPATSGVLFGASLNLK